MRAHGFSLVEVLVAVSVLAIGALGAMSTHSLARRSSTEAVLQARAAILADSLSIHFTDHYLGEHYDAMHSPPPVLSASCEAHECEAAQLAEGVMARARQELFVHFPGGRLVICRDSAVVEPDSGRLRWDCDAAPGAPAWIKIGWAGHAHPMVSRMVVAP